MSKKLMVPFLTEWLIKHGTEEVTDAQMGVIPMNELYTAIRKGYINDRWCIFETVYMKRITEEGIKYIKENTK